MTAWSTASSATRFDLRFVPDDMQLRTFVLLIASSQDVSKELHDDGLQQGRWSFLDEDGARHNITKKAYE